MDKPPERFNFPGSDSSRRGPLKFTHFCTKSRPLLQQTQHPIFSLSLTHFSLFFFTIHLLLHFSFSISHFNIHLLIFWTSDSDSLRQGALGRTPLLKLHQNQFLGLLQSQSSNHHFSYLYVKGRDLLNLVVKFIF